MSIPPINDDLAHAHEVFRKNHDAGRQRLLGMLSDGVSHFPTIRRRSMRSVIRALASRPLFGHWQSKLAVAALLFAALAISFCVLRHGPEQTAYALDDLPRRLLDVKSVYATGWMFYPDSILEPYKGVRAKYPVKCFAERPDCYWHTWFSYNGPDKSHKNGRVQTGYAAGRGTRMLSVSTNDKTAVETTVAAIHNELSVEITLQSQLPQQLLSGHPQDFVKTGTETVNNVSCDVYEHSSDMNESKRRLWLDPKTGLPVKTASYRIDKTGKEEMISLFDHVEVNIPTSDTGLSFDPPEGYQFTKAPQSTAANPLQAIASGWNSNDSVSVMAGVWHSFNIDDKAVLLCWYWETRSGSQTSVPTMQPELLLGGTRPCDVLDVASTDAGDHHWKWSLVYPKHSGEQIGNDDFSLIHRLIRQGSELILVDHPLRLREDRLKAILEEVQRVTKTVVPGTSEPLTLDMLRKRLDERRRR